MAERPEVSVILRRVLAAEKKAREAEAHFKIARAEYRLAVSEYAAARDLAKSLVGRFPYAPEIQWPDNNDRGSGEFRFREMNATSLAIAVLQETGRPMTAEEILQYAGEDGFGLSVQLRSVTAALRALRVIKQMPDGRFAFKDDLDEEGDVEPDDLPFE